MLELFLVLCLQRFKVWFLHQQLSASSGNLLDKNSQESLFPCKTYWSETLQHSPLVFLAALQVMWMCNHNQGV